MPIDWEKYEIRHSNEGHGRTDDPFFSKPQSAKQRRALRSAEREVFRGERALRTAIGDDALEAELRGGRLDTFFEDPLEVIFSGIRRAGHSMSVATQPLFDLLQIGQFTAAGAALEIVNNGWSYEALRRASTEFLNALPYVDEKEAAAMTGVDPTRASFRDVLEAADVDFFDNDRHNELGRAAAGFLMDVVFDPMTWVGGAAFRAAGKGLSKASMPFMDVKGIKHVRQGLGRRFSPHFDIREAARNSPQLKESTEMFLQGLERRRGEISQGSVEVKDLALQLKARLSPTQGRFLQLYLDQPRHFDSILNELTVGNPKSKELMEEKFMAFKNAYTKLADDEVASGVMDPTILKADYAPARWPATHTSQRSFKDMMNKLGLPEEVQNFEISNLVESSPNIVGEAKPGFTLAKKFGTLEQRVLTATGTELDPGVAYAIRGIESVRARATKRFADAVLSDPRVAVKVTDATLFETIKKGGANKSLQALVEEYGQSRGAEIFETASDFAKQLNTRDFEVWRPFREATEATGDVGSISKLSVGQRFVDDEGFTYAVTSKIGKKGKKKGKVAAERIDTNEEVLFDKGYEVTPFEANPAYVMPKSFVREITLADKIMKNESEANELLKGMAKIQNVWKGWAVLSPGFHARNTYSNWFNNALAGVGFRKGFIPDPMPYARAFPLIFGRGANVALKMNGSVLKGSEITDLARRHNVIETGVFARDMPLDVEEEMLSRLFKTKNKDNLFESLSTSTGKSLDRALTAASEGNKIITRRDLLTSVAETAPAKADFQFLPSVFGQKNPVLQANRWLGEKMEDHSRLSHFIDKISKGATPEEAAQSVKRYLFDYGELTEFERDVMKVVMPFYTWMRKNIPLQFQSIVENPGRYAKLTAKPIDAIESLSEDWDHIPTPDYFQEVHAVRMPREVADLMRVANEAFDDAARRLGVVSSDTPEGTGLQPTYVNPNFPFQDLNRLNYKDMLSSMTPIVKLPIETLMGEGGRGFSIFLDRPIEKFPGEPTEFGLLGTETRLRKKNQHILETVFPTLGKAQRLLDRLNRGQGASQALSELGGIRALQVDIERAKRSNVFRRRAAIRAIAQKYRQLGLIR